jgi:putative hydrolase of the HAD superfamily
VIAPTLIGAPSRRLPAENVPAPGTLSPVRAVAFDAMGVLYRSGDDVGDVLIPFARARGSRLSDDEVRRRYRRASVGELTSAQLWAELGVPGAPDELDATYVQGLEVTPGIPDLLDDLASRGVVVGCISNDIAEWSRAARRHHALDRAIERWTISGEVRSRKPEERIYRAFLETVGRAPSDVIVIDDRLINIQAASALGFAAVLVDFAGAGSTPAALPTVAALRAALAERGVLP